jgi:polysaccharide biosynthesis protein PslH
MRLLAISSWWPEPANNGSRMRIANLLRILAEQHEIYLIALNQEPVIAEQIARMRTLCASVDVIQQRFYTSRRSDLLTSLFHQEPASVRQTYDPAVADLAARRAAEVRPDAVIAFQMGVAPYTYAVDAPRILEELEVGLLLQQFLGQSDPARRMRAWLTWQKHRGYVAQVAKHFDAATVASEHELVHARAIVPAHMNLAVIPNGADIAGCANISAASDPDTLIYPGALSFDANLDAMIYFLEAVFPRIRAARPQTRLRITGKYTAAQRDALPTLDGVELTGFLPDVRPAVAGAAVAVVPLRRGGGTRLKILEALALGTPVVATSKGAEGLELLHGQDLLIADTPDAFAEATLQLMADPELRQRIAAAGRAAVRERYDWRSIGGRLCELVVETAQTRRGGHVYSTF